MPPEHKKSSKSQEFIEQNLKRVYQETLEEDVPDRFKELLARLKETGPSGGAKS